MKNERRKYPRVSLDSEVSILVSGVVRTATVVHASPAGIEIDCRRRLIEQINQHKSEAGLFPEFDLEFLLPGEVSVKARCNVACCRRLSQDRYNLAMQFTRLSVLDEERLDDFIHQAAAVAA